MSKPTPAQILGSLGGKAGRGKRKRRGDSEHYAKLARLAAQKRKENRAKQEGGE